MYKYAFSLLFLLYFLPLYAFQNPISWKEKMSTQVLQGAEFPEKKQDVLLLLATKAASDLVLPNSKASKTSHVVNLLKQESQLSQKDLIAYLKAKSIAYRSFFLVNAIQLKADFPTLQRLAQFEKVEKIISNTKYRVSETTQIQTATIRDSLYSWGVERVHAPEVWARGYEGQGIVIGGQDTGYDWTHPVLKTKYRGYIDENTVDHNYNWHDAIYEIDPLHGDSIIDASNNPCGLQSPEPCDDNGHGTHTMGTMVGTSETHITGVAPQASWMCCRNMERGWGKISTYIECFEFFIAPTDLNGENPRPDLAPDVIANSWSCPEEEGCNPENFAVMETVVNNVKAAGIVVVVSAGNAGPECSSISTPAAIFESSFTVGATNIEDEITSFSSRGPVNVDNSMRRKPDISAPGRDILSSVPGGGFASFSGTSMAGPHVAGVVALLMSANPALKGQVEVIENIIEQTALPKETEQDCGEISGMTIPNNTYGYGIIDAEEAVNRALEWVNTETITESNIKVYPNPFQHRLSVDVSTLNGKFTLKLYNSAGVLMRAYETVVNGEAEKNFDLPTLAKGVYFYKIDTEDVSYSGKLVK